MSFGATPLAPPAFGAQQPGSISFGAAPASTTTPQFGPALGKLGVSTSTTTASPALNYGISPAPLGAGLFGTTTPSASLGLAQQTTATTTLQSGLFATPIAAPNIGSSFTVQTSTTTPSIGLTAGTSFGPSSLVTATSTSAPSLPLLGTGFGGLGTTTTPSSATTTGLSFGLGGFTGLKTTVGTTPRVGLGGTNAVTETPTSTAAAVQAEIAAKDQNLPDKLLSTVQEFSKFVKQQKDYSSEIARYSAKELFQVEKDIVVVVKAIKEMELQLEKNEQIARKLSSEIGKSLGHIAMAQSTFDTPVGLQNENTAPFNMFDQLATDFEKDLQIGKSQVGIITKILCSKKESTLNPSDLASAMTRLHDTFVALAGRLYSVHNQVQQQKQQYLLLRKRICNDNINVFEANPESDIDLQDFSSMSQQTAKEKVGPTPFTALGRSQVQVLAQNSSAGSTLPVPGLGMNATAINAPTASLFGGVGAGNPLGASSSGFFFNNSPNTSAFQLQKPPVGAKRGKS